MQGVVVDRPGGVEVLQVRQLPRPDCGPDQVLVRVAYCGCNFADTQVRRGVYAHAIKYPVVPGFEISGTIIEVGDNVCDVKVGQRVAGITSGGGYAEICAAQAEHVFPIPQEMPFDIAAAFQIQSLTCYHMLHTIYSVKSNDTVLLHAAGGGVGLFCIQLATMAGARVIGTVGSSGKADKALSLGASYIVDRRAEDFVNAVMRLTNGKGADLAIDSLGAETLDRTFDAMRPLGHVINIGEAEGTPFNNIRERLLPKSLTFTRFHGAHVGIGSEPWNRGVRYVSEAIAKGKLEVPIVQRYPLDQVQEMHRALEGRGVSGKLLLSLE